MARAKKPVNDGMMQVDIDSFVRTRDSVRYFPFPSILLIQDPAHTYQIEIYKPLSTSKILSHPANIDFTSFNLNHHLLNALNYLESLIPTHPRHSPETLKIRDARGPHP